MLDSRITICKIEGKLFNIKSLTYLGANVYLFAVAVFACMLVSIHLYEVGQDCHKRHNSEAEISTQ